MAPRASAAGARSIRDGAGAAAQRGDVQRSGGGDGAVEVEPRRMGLSQPWPNLGQEIGVLTTNHGHDLAHKKRQIKGGQT